MWPRLSFNRPLIWLGLSAMSAVLWLPSVSLRLGALLLMAVAMWDGWRQVKLEQRRSRLTEQVM